MGLILLTRNASALCLMLGATHLIALCATLVEQSSSARLQASLQTRSASIIWRRKQPDGRYDRCGGGCYRGSLQVKGFTVAFPKKLRKNFHKKVGHIIFGFYPMMCPIYFVNDLCVLHMLCDISPGLMQNHRRGIQCFRAAAHPQEHRAS